MGEVLGAAAVLVPSLSFSFSFEVEEAARRRENMAL